MGVFMVFMMMVQALQENQQAKDAGELGKANAALQREEDQEATRRAKLEMRKKEATARSRIAASGIKGGEGSSQVYMDELKGVHATELAWMNKSTASRYQLGVRGANLERQAGQTRALGTAVSAAQYTEVKKDSSGGTYWGFK